MQLSFLHRFPSTDPWLNLAREEAWFDALAPGESALILYVNRPCIVMGKHQNPLREVRLAEAASRGIPLVRRSSGGGTVYHDEGNLNWSVIVPKERYQRETVSAMVADALRELGVSLTIGEKGDLFLGDKKVSGAAYQVRRDRVLHHGTLLCQARLDDLHGVLGPTGTVTEWVGVASRPMPVTNLGVTVDAAASALARLVPGEVGSGRGNQDFEAKVEARALELKGRDWLWGQTPPFRWEGDTRFGRLSVRVEAGKIVASADDTNQFMSKMTGNYFFDSQFFEYIPGEVL